MKFFSGKNLNCLLAILAAAIFFLIWWLRDYPKPMVDDLYYTGAALHMAQGGDFSNPLIERQAYPSHFFFVYPPLHSYALLGWLKMFGISTLSMTGFHIFLCYIIAASAIAILRKHDAPAIMLWIVPLAVSTSLFATGLRSEALSIGLTMAGLAILECLPIGYATSFTGFLLMFLGGSVAPRIAFFSGALIVFSAYKIFTQNRTGTGSGKPIAIISGGLAFLCTVFIFLVQIQFRVAEFWHTFHVHAVLVNGRVFDRIVGYLNENRYVDGSQAPLIWTLAALILFAWPKKMSASLLLSITIGAGFILETLAKGLGAGVLWYVAFALILYVAAVVKFSPMLRTRLLGVLIFLLLIANAKFLVAEYERVKGWITMDSGDQRNVALNMRSTPEHPILVDCATARYVYDYKLPDGVFDIEFSAPFPDSHIVQKPRREDIYVIGPDNVEILKECAFLALPIEKRTVLGLNNRRFTREPCKVYIIPAEDLHFTGDLPK